MAKKALRGTKRTCQSGSCGERFYDLNRDPILCPICGHAYVIAHGPAEPAREEPARRPARKPEPVVAGATAAGDKPEVDPEDALADVDVEGDDAIADDDDETFLEDEEDEGGDVKGIVSGPGGDDDES